MNRTRRLRLSGSLAACGLLTFLTACGGGGGSSSGASTSTTAVAATAAYSAADAARLAKQATFGPTQALVDQIVATGSAGAWIDQQLAAAGSTYSDLAPRAVATNYCSAMAAASQSACYRDYQSSLPVAMEFYSHAMQNSDQLRQRVAFALSQLIVASDVEVHSTAGQAVFNQILVDGAFGNYHDLLKAVTLNPYMGDYLDMANSAKSLPNENYARELMQLFSMGVNSLNTDGTVKTDATGAAIPNYTPDDVHNVARALTGWTYTRLNGAAITDNTNIDYSKPMIQNAAIYDTTAKSFLGVTVAAGATQDASLQAVVDAVFNNASTGPYIAKFLIGNLVASNPSAAYVSRVATVFNNDGTGVRGNLKAVVRAILTDAEARGDAKSGASDGKVKEPILFMTAVGRLIGDKSDGYAFTTRDQGLGQQVFRAPSVFNFYPPDYPLPLGGGLQSPPSKLMTTSTIINRHNLAYDWTISGDSRTEYATQAINGATGTQPDWSSWEAFGADVAGMINRINLIMLNNTMTDAQKSALTTAVNAVTNTDATVQARKRAQTALYIVATSPQFQVDR